MRWGERILSAKKGVFSRKRILEQNALMITTADQLEFMCIQGDFKIFFGKMEFKGEFTLV